MKAFEEWAKENGSEDYGWYEWSEEAWKAALKWILNNDDAYCCGSVDGYDEWENCPIRTAIEKELKDTE